MGVQDITEKSLEGLPDVFADIVNVLLFNGRQVISPKNLSDSTVRSIYKAEGQIFEQERDVAKSWKNEVDINIALIGFENQTRIESNMPIRVISYDGANYRYQIRRIDEARKAHHESPKLYPVITLVLYFGMRKWVASPNLIDHLEIPNELKPFVSDYKMNLFQIAYLDNETIDKFQSDFRTVARFFADRRKLRDGEISELTETTQELMHAKEVFEMLGALTGDNRFESAYDDVVRAGKEQTMCSVLNEIQEKGRAEGRVEGRVEGRAEGRAEGHTEGWSDAKNYYLEALIQNLMSENPSLSKDAAKKRAIQLLGISEK